MYLYLNTGSKYLLQHCRNVIDGHCHGHSRSSVNIYIKNSWVFKDDLKVPERVQSWRPLSDWNSNGYVSNMIGPFHCLHHMDYYDTSLAITLVDIVYYLLTYVLKTISVTPSAAQWTHLIVTVTIFSRSWVRSSLKKSIHK